MQYALMKSRANVSYVSVESGGQTAPLGPVSAAGGSLLHPSRKRNPSRRIQIAIEMQPSVRRRMRRAFLALEVALVASWAPPLRAQSCHVAAANEHGTSGFRLSGRAEAAGFVTSRYEGHYEGVFASLLVANETISGEVSLPLYRIVRNGLRDQGPGDLSLAGRARLLAVDDERVTAGFFAAVALPTGDPEKDLGMGHVMIMPGAWARARVEPVVLSAELAYGASIETSRGDAHQHHGKGESPLVNPMNPSELEPLATATLELSAPFSVRGGAFGGIPFGEGATRTVAFLGVDVARGAFGARVQGFLPLVGDPFTSKLALELSIGF